jgi:hypothetical protein
MFADLKANLLNSVVRGQQLYDDSEIALRNSIRRYNEAIGDFTASCVIGISSFQRGLPE